MNEDDSKTQTSNSTQPLSEAVREAVESGQDIAGEVRKIVVDLFRGNEGAAASARKAIQGMVETATEVANRAAPDKAESALRNVIDGIGSGLKSVAQTTQYAVQEAADRGQRFANEDVERAKKDLTGIKDILLDTVKYFSDRVNTETGTAIKELKTHAERTLEAAKPVVTSSLEALTKHPIQTAGEAAGTAVRGSQLTAGALLSFVSGALAGAAELIDPARRPKPEEKPATETPSDAKL
jgi:hypothetical protein